MEGTLAVRVAKETMTDRFAVYEGGEVYLLVENDPPIEDDWGSGVPLTAAEVLRGALRILGEDLLADAIELERKSAIPK